MLKNPHSQITPVEITFLENPPHAQSTLNKAISSEGNKKASRNGSLGNQSALNLKNHLLNELKYKSIKSLQASDAQALTGEAADKVRDFQGSGAFVEQVGFQEGLESTTFWSHLLAKVEASFDYPQDFADQRIQGDVKLEFYVNRKGQIIDEFKAINGSEPLLNLYAMAVIHQSLKEPLPRNFWSASDKEKLAVSFTIRFEYYQMDETKISNIAHYQNNDFFIRKTRYVMPLLLAKIDKVFTRYVPPIIPVPGGVYVDIVRLAQFSYNLVNGTPDPDEMRKQRIKATRQQLELSLRKKNP